MKTKHAVIASFIAIVALVAAVEYADKIMPQAGHQAGREPGTNKSERSNSIDSSEAALDFARGKQDSLKGRDSVVKSYYDDEPK